MANGTEQQYVVIVGAGELTLPAYRIAREELGLGIVGLDGAADAPGMALADIPLVVSTKDVPAAVAAVKTLAVHTPIVGVFTCGADVEVTVASIAAALGTPGISPEVAYRCHDKLAMHQFLDEKGFTQKAPFQVISTFEDLQKAAKSIGFPNVIKPLDNCASRGVQRIEAEHQLLDAYNLATSFTQASDNRVLLEKCLEGTKHTVEMITWHGEWHLLSIIDTHYISPRWPCETGLNTTRLDDTIQRRLFEFSSNLAELIGIDIGAHKVDVNLSPSGDIDVIELTARLSGGYHCQYASPLAYGSHDIRAALKLSVGRELDIDDIRHRHDRGAAVQAVFPTPGQVTAINGRDDVLAAPGVEELFIWAKVGDVVGPYQSSANRPAFVIASGSDADDAIANAKHGAALLQIETKVIS